MAKADFSGEISATNCEISPFVEDWDIVQTLGEGAFGEVKLLMNRRTHYRIALKIIDLNLPDCQDTTRKEVLILRMLKHENVIGFIGQRRLSNIQYVFLEYAAGGELFDRIEPDVGVPEFQANRYFRQLIEGTEYLHSRGVAHRDLKPENLLLTDSDVLKISDFGMATIFRFKGQERLLTKRCGTLPYVAPEVLVEHEYRAEPAEIWSCGIILVALLAGELPWDSPDVTCCRRFSDWLENFKKSSSDNRWRHQSPFSKIDNCALSLLRQMLNCSPEQRATITCIKSHQWFIKDLAKRRKNHDSNSNSSDECQNFSKKFCFSNNSNNKNYYHRRSSKSPKIPKILAKFNSRKSMINNRIYCAFSNNDDESRDDDFKLIGCFSQPEPTNHERRRDFNAPPTEFERSSSSTNQNRANKRRSVLSRDSFIDSSSATAAPPTDFSQLLSSTNDNHDDGGVTLLDDDHVTAPENDAGADWSFLIGDHRFLGFSQPANFDNMLINTQSQCSQPFLNPMQKLVKRMTRFYVTVSIDRALSDVDRLLSDRFGFVVKRSAYHQQRQLTVHAVDSRRNDLIFKAAGYETFDRRVLIDFRLSKGDGLDFKRIFVKLRDRLKSIIDHAGLIDYWSFADLRHDAPNRDNNRRPGNNDDDGGGDRKKSIIVPATQTMTKINKNGSVSSLYVNNLKL